MLKENKWTKLCKKMCEKKDEKSELEERLKCHVYNENLKKADELAYEYLVHKFSK